ncbi:MAG: hypothetical protein RLZZ621_2741, partial [Gemmatimonadota bacterium]
MPQRSGRHAEHAIGFERRAN